MKLNQWSGNCHEKSQKWLDRTHELLYARDESTFVLQLKTSFQQNKNPVRKIASSNMNSKYYSYCWTPNRQCVRLEYFNSLFSMSTNNFPQHTMVNVPALDLRNILLVRTQLLLTTIHLLPFGFHLSLNVGQHWSHSCSRERMSVIKL